MEQLLKITAAPATALFALALVAMATPAAASPNQYCRRDITEYGALSCGFETMAQCQAMASGRGGDCVPNPSVSNASSSAFAFQPKQPLSKSGTHRARKPVAN